MQNEGGSLFFGSSATRKDMAPVHTSKYGLTPRTKEDNSIIFINREGKPVSGYEKGVLNVTLPSGKSANIFQDSRIRSSAEYAPETNGFVFSPQTISEIRNPSKHAADGWVSVEQRTHYLLSHEYNHFVWESLSDQEKKKVIGIFTGPKNIQRTRAFGAALITKPDYQRKETHDPRVDSLSFLYGNRTHRFSKELIVNELLAHAVLGETMKRNQIDAIVRANPARENFARRSKDAIDCLSAIKQTSPLDYAYLVQVGLVEGKQYRKDSPELIRKAIKL